MKQLLFTNEEYQLAMRALEREDMDDPTLSAPPLTDADHIDPDVWSLSQGAV